MTKGRRSQEREQLVEIVKPGEGLGQRCKQSDRTFQALRCDFQDLDLLLHDMLMSRPPLVLHKRKDFGAVF